MNAYFPSKWQRQVRSRDRDSQRKAKILSLLQRAGKPQLLSEVMCLHGWNVRRRYANKCRFVG